MSNESEENPTNASEWRGHVGRLVRQDTKNLLLGDIIAWNSGSKLLFEQFLHLKVLCIHRNADQFRLDQYIEKDAALRAGKLAKSRPCRKFCQAVTSERGLKEFKENSAFSPASLYMDFVRGFAENADEHDDSNKIFLRPRPRTRAMTLQQDLDPLETPSGRKGGKSPATGLSTGTPYSQLEYRTPAPEGGSPMNPEEFKQSQDENIVNMALILLLNTLTERAPEMRQKGYHWMPDRAAFKINDNRDRSAISNTKKERILEARVDGHLRSGSGLSAAIVEVKPYLRKHKWNEIQWQEAAQMSAHISAIIRERVSKSAFGLLKSQNPGMKRQVLHVCKSTCI